MKTMLLAFLTIGLIAVGANYALQNAGFSSRELQTGVNARSG